MERVISTPNASTAIGSYSQAMALGGMFITSSQLGFNPQSGAFVSGDASTQTERVFRNLKVIFDEAGFILDQVVKTTYFFADIGDFAAMNAVYEKCFSGAFSTCSAIAVKTLPKGEFIRVEVVTHR